MTTPEKSGDLFVLLHQFVRTLTLLGIVPISISLNEAEPIYIHVHGLGRYDLSISQHHSLYIFPVSVRKLVYQPRRLKARDFFPE